MAELIQFCLPNKAPQTSGRGVRFALLNPVERNQALLSAATLAGEDKAKLNLLRQFEGVKRMVRAVTGWQDGCAIVTTDAWRWPPPVRPTRSCDSWVNCGAGRPVGPQVATPSAPVRQYQQIGAPCPPTGEPASGAAGQPSGLSSHASRRP